MRLKIRKLSHPARVRGLKPEWIAKSLVDEDGKVMFTKKQVEDNFIHPLANAIFDEIFGTKSLKKYLDKKAEVEGKSQEKTSSSSS